MNVLLVPAHPGFPGQIPQSRKTVVCVCVFACLGGYNMEHCRSPDGVTSVSVRLYRTTQCCRAFTLALARLSYLVIAVVFVISAFIYLFAILHRLLY